MDEEQNKVKDELAEEKTNTQQESQNGVSLEGVVLLLVLILICNLYLCYTTFAQSGSFSSSHRVLLVSLEDDISASNASDSVQVNNGLHNGGTIRIKDSNDGYAKAFGKAYMAYGAENSSGSLWTKGAVLNYISSHGWKLIQAPSTGFSDTYYFTR